MTVAPHSPSLPRHRALRAVAVATLLCLVFAAGVYVGFVPVRFKLVRAPVAPVAGRVDLAVEEGTLRGTVAVIARIENQAPGKLPIVIRVDGTPACALDVAAATTRRVDCAATVSGSSPVHHVSIDAAVDSWRVHYLELSNVHGSSRGALSFILVPSASRAFERPSAAWIAAAWILLALLFLMPASGRIPGAVLTAWRIAAAITVVTFVLVLATGFVSPYTMALSPGTFLEGVLVLVAPRGWRVYRALGERRPAARASLGRSILVAAAVLAAFGMVAGDRLASFGGNYSGFVQISRAAYDRVPFLSTRGDIRRTLILLNNTGYDGQFMYFAAFDPLLRQYRNEPARYDEVVDTAPYRYGRIAFSALTSAVSVGRWERLPAAMVWIVLVATFLSALLLSRLAVQHGASPAWGLLVLLVPGFWRSLQMALPESLAASSLLLGLLLLRRGRHAAAGLAFALSLLTRETGLAFVACAIVATGWKGRWRGAGILAVASLLPPIAWHLYVGSVLSPTWGARAYFFDPQIVGIPFAGISRMWSVTAAGQNTTGLGAAAFTFPFVLVTGLLLAGVLAIRQPGTVTIAALVYAALAVSLNYANVWSHAWNAVRASYELFLLLAVATIEWRQGSGDRGLRRFVVGCWLVTGAYIALYGW